MGEVGGHAFFPSLKGDIELRFEDENITPYAGIYLLREFFRKIRLTRFIRKLLRVQKRDRYYSTCELFLSVIYAILFGFERMPHTNILGCDRAFLGITGLKAFPDPSSLWRFLMRLDQDHIAAILRMNQTYLRKMLSIRPGKRVIIDMDSTVLTVYGHQEGAAIGYNPAKPGRPSYHPVCAFLGEEKDFITGCLRPGDVHSGKDSVSLFENALRAAGAKGCNLRTDSGFYDIELVRYCETSGVKFAIVAKQTQPIKRVIYGLKYKEFDRDFSEAEFEYAPVGWTRPRRFVVIRQRLKEKASGQMTFFPEERWRYQVIVTNLRSKPRRVWRFYNGRANVENVIKELKLSMNMEKVPTGSFIANHGYFQIIMFAYNLLNWLRRLCLSKDQRSWTAKTIRQCLLWVPGKFTVHGRKKVLSIPESYLYRRAYLSSLEGVQGLKFEAS